VSNGRFAKHVEPIDFSQQKSRCFCLVLMNILRSLLNSSRLRMEAVIYSKTSVTIYQSIRRHVSADF